jgi:tetratricopeptide (TPR) repeat protein
MKSSSSCVVVAALALALVDPLGAASEEPPPEAAVVMVIGRHFTGEAGGNGFVIGDGTLAVTCAHMGFERSARGSHRAPMLLTVFSPYLGEACEAHVVASDEELDLAVLEIPWRGHPALRPGDANAVTAARACRVIALRTAMRHASEPDFTPGEGETWEPDGEELPVFFIGVRRGTPQFVELEGIGRLGPGWSGSPMLVPGTSVAIGCFATLDRRGLGDGKIIDRGARGPALNQVFRLLGEGTGKDRLCPPTRYRGSPEDAREACALALRAMHAVQPGRYEFALEPVRAFLKLRPDSVFGHRVLARAGEETGQREAARASYRRALELDPSSIHTRIYYAQFLGRNGEPNEALQILEPLWNSGRMHDLVGLALMNVLSQRKEFGRCLAILEEAAANNPRNAYVWQQMAACHLQMEGPAAALEPLTRAVELLPERGPFRGGLAQLLETTGALDEAEKHFRKLLEIEPQNPVVYYWLADFLRRHRPALQEEAVQVAEKALGLAPHSHLPREEIEKLIKQIQDAASSTTPQ